MDFSKSIQFFTSKIQNFDCYSFGYKKSLNFSQVKEKSFDFARSLILPKNAHDEHKKLAHADQYSCIPPPLFMLTITILEVTRFP